MNRVEVGGAVCMEATTQLAHYRIVKLSKKTHKAASSSHDLYRDQTQGELAKLEAFVSLRGNVGKDLTVERHAAGK